VLNDVWKEGKIAEEAMIMKKHFQKGLLSHETILTGTFVLFNQIFSKNKNIQ
jgi:hypothetical protein